MAGYIDYDLYTEVEDKLIKTQPVYKRKDYWEKVLEAAILVVSLPETPILYFFEAKGIGLSLTRVGAEEVEQILEKKALPEVITSVEAEAEELPVLLAKSDIREGMELNPTKNAVFRGGNKFKARVGKDYELDPQTGLVETTDGVSLNANPEALKNFRGGVYQIKSIPEELKIVQSGGRTHFGIVPRQPMTEQKYQALLDKITLFEK